MSKNTMTIDELVKFWAVEQGNSAECLLGREVGRLRAELAAERVERDKWYALVGERNREIVKLRFENDALRGKLYDAAIRASNAGGESA